MKKRETPRPPRKKPQSLDLGKGLKLSFALHGSLIAVALLNSLVFPSRPVHLAPTLRVDLVGLPDFLKKDKPKLTQLPPLEETPPPPRAEPPKPKEAEPAQKDEMVLKPKKVEKAENEKEDKNRAKKMSTALAKIKALAKINSELEKQSAPVIKGNRISRGASLDDDARESADVNYYDLLREHLHGNWTLPVWLSRQNLSAHVEIFLDSQGKLMSFRFVKASGNTQFDDAVKRTLQQSQPYPKPPAEVGKTVAVNGVLVRFPL